MWGFLFALRLFRCSCWLRMCLWISFFRFLCRFSFAFQSDNNNNKNSVKNLKTHFQLENLKWMWMQGGSIIRRIYVWKEISDTDYECIKLFTHLTCENLPFTHFFAFVQQRSGTFKLTFYLACVSVCLSVRFKWNLNPKELSPYYAEYEFAHNFKDDSGKNT